MYGGFDGYKTVVKITAKIAAVQQVPKGCGVGYGSKFIAPNAMCIGVVSCGYADCGYLLFGHTTHVYVGKTACKILGTVCMDTFAIDVTHVANPRGKTVTILADKPGAAIMDFVNTSKTSACRLLCSLDSSRAD